MGATNDDVEPADDHDDAESPSAGRSARHSSSIAASRSCWTERAKKRWSCHAVEEAERESEPNLTSMRRSATRRAKSCCAKSKFIAANLMASPTAPSPPSSTSPRPRSRRAAPVSHTQLTKEQIQEQAAAALQDALKISDEAEKAEKIREVGKAEGKLLSALLTQSGVTAIAPSHPVVSSWYSTLQKKIVSHDHYYTRYSKVSSSFTIILIILNSFVSACTFLGGGLGTGSTGGSGSGFGAASTLQVVAGGVGIAVAATTAILSRLKFGELSRTTWRRAARTAAQAADGRARRRAQARAHRRRRRREGVDGRQGPNASGQAFLEDWDTVLNDAPPMSLAMQAELYRRKITAQATEGALDIEGGLPDLASAGVSAAAAARAALSQGVEMGARLLEKGRTTSEGRA